MTLLYLDTEFRHTRKPDRIIPIVFCALDDEGQSYEVSFRDPAQGREELAVLVDHFRDATWLAFSAKAEMEFLHSVGIDASTLRWIDLMAEARQITGSDPDFLSRKAGFVAMLQAMGLPLDDPQMAIKKDRMHRLCGGMAPFADRSTESFTDEEWREISDYCHSDVRPLPRLYEAIRRRHAKDETSWSPQIAHYRGGYVAATAKLHHRSKGIPIDRDWAYAIFDNRERLRVALAERTNEKFGAKLFVPNRDGTYSYSHRGLEQLLESFGGMAEWERTASGKFRRHDQDFMKEFVETFEQFKPLKSTLDTMNQLKGVDLRELEHDGWVKPLSLPLYTKTGRNQPMVKEGFIFNMPPWLRSVVRPPPGYTLTMADWSKQEIGIAAALLGDEAFLAAYNSEDIYTELGRMAGLIPPDGDQNTHPIERQACKSTQLGLGYGMGVRTLGLNLLLDLREAGHKIEIGEASERAEYVFQWHKATFTDYWGSLERLAEQAVTTGWCHSRDGWVYFANDDPDVLKTRLLNFPMQSNGAAMLREAVRRVAKTDLDLTCSLHDALYILSPDDLVDEHEAKLVEIMNVAVERIIGPEVRIKIRIKHFTHDKPYWDKRGKETYNWIREELGLPCAP